MVERKLFCRNFYLLLCLFIFFFCVTNSSKAFGEIRNLGKEGAVYDIAEKDAMEEIRERLARVDIEAIKARLKQSVIKKLNNINVSGIGKATKDEVRSFRPVFTLPFDIKDEKGRIIYPKGYTFNPLQLFTFPYIFVFIDGSSQKEIEWFLNNSTLSDRWDIILMITKGSIFDSWAKLGRYVFAADKRIVDWLQVKRTPSIVYQKEDYFVVVEFGIHKKNVR